MAPTRMQDLCQYTLHYVCMYECIWDRLSVVAHIWWRCNPRRVNSKSKMRHLIQRGLPLSRDRCQVTSTCVSSSKKIVLLIAFILLQLGQYLCQTILNQYNTRIFSYSTLHKSRQFTFEIVWKPASKKGISYVFEMGNHSDLCSCLCLNK